MARPTTRCVHQLGDNSLAIPARISPIAHNCSVCRPDEKNKLCPHFCPVTLFVFQVKETPEDIPQELLQLVEA